MLYFNLNLIPNSRGQSWLLSKPGEIYMGSPISISTPWNAWAQILKRNCKDYEKLVEDLHTVCDRNITTARLRVTFDKHSFDKDVETNAFAAVSHYVKFDNVVFRRRIIKFDYSVVEQFGTF